MANVFDQFDTDTASPPAEKNVFDQFDQTNTPPAPPAYQFTPPPDAPETPAPPTPPSITRTAVGTVERNIAPLAAAIGATKVAGPATAAVGKAVGGFVAKRVAGALTGAGIGALIPGVDLSGIPEVIGGLVGLFAPGFIAQMIAQKAQTKIADVVAPKSELGTEETAAEEQAHPNVSTAVGLLTIGRPNPFKLVRAGQTIASGEGRAALSSLLGASKDAGSLAAWRKATAPAIQNGVNDVIDTAHAGAINAAFNVAGQIQSGQYSATELAKAAAEGTLFNSPWINARHPATAQFDAAKQSTTEDSNASDITSPAQVPVRNEGESVGGQTSLQQQGEAAPIPPPETPPGIVAPTLTREQKAGLKALQNRGVEPDVARATLFASGGKSTDETDEQFRDRLFQLHDQLGFKVKKEATQFQGEDALREQMKKDGWTPEQQEAGIADARLKNQAKLGQIDQSNKGILEQIANPSFKPAKVPAPAALPIPPGGAPARLQQLKAIPDGQLTPELRTERDTLQAASDNVWGNVKPKAAQNPAAPAQAGVKPGQMTKPESDELSALRKKDLSDDGLTKDEEQRLYELSRKETQSNRAAKTSKMAGQLKEQGVDIPDSFLHPSDGVENHITSWTYDHRNGMMQIRVERHTNASMSGRLITVKAGDVLTDGMDDSKVGTTRYREANPDAALRAGEKPQTPPATPAGVAEPISAAVLTKTGELVTGNSHDEIYGKGAKKGEEGFILPSGEFIPRKEAAKRFAGRQHSHEFDFGKPLGELYESARENLGASPREFEKAFAKDADAEVKESKSEFLKRMFCSGKFPKKTSTMSE